MIDQDLVSKNVGFLSRSFLEKKKLSDCVFTLKSCITNEAMFKIYDYILNEPAKPWQLETTEFYQDNNVPRRKISWHSETVVEELHMTADSLTPLVSTDVGKDLKFHGIVLWEDSESYHIDWHTDNPILTATMQIYLAGPPSNPGTELEIGSNRTYTCDFEINTGYYINQNKYRPRHRTHGEVPSKTSRYSLFAMWT